MIQKKQGMGGAGRNSQWGAGSSPSLRGLSLSFQSSSLGNRLFLPDRVKRAVFASTTKFSGFSSGTTQPYKRESSGVRRNLGGHCEGPRLWHHEEPSCWLSCSPDLHPECPPRSCHTYGAVPLPSQAGWEEKQRATSRLLPFPVF